MKILKFVLWFLIVLSVLVSSILLTTYYLLPKIETPISILILGKGGEGHTAPNLTDTIMLTHLDAESMKVTNLSIPRDIWISEIRAKLNTAYHYGGFEMAKNSVASITGIVPDYGVVIDFSLFKDLIDSMGGINIDVENSFVDEKFPISGKENDPCVPCRYEKIVFEKGLTKMDGETALKFARSRNAKGDEGTDLAREKRQQKIVEAIKNRFLSNEVLLNKKTLNNIYNVFLKNLETDIPKDKIIPFARFLFESRQNIKFLTIPEEYLAISQKDKRYDYQYVFLPKSGTWDDLQKWIVTSLQN
jgi:LCP family protein required for cell wall assembly